MSSAPARPLAPGRVIAETGSKFLGEVVGGNVYVAALGASSTGTITGHGATTSLSGGVTATGGFGAIVLDKSAAWQLAGGLSR